MQLTWYLIFSVICCISSIIGGALYFSAYNEKIGSWLIVGSYIGYLLVLFTLIGQSLNLENAQ